ncbi:MAG: periplasmic heavy metal sensor [Nitrospirae bacterium]|nr:periplasmic heavy metal sensor [Nitrospirota bacterium]
MKRRISAVVSLFSLVTLSFVLSGPGAFADPDQDSYGAMSGKPGMGMGHPGMMQQGKGMYGFPGSMTSYLRERLNLDDKQFEQLHKLYSEYEKEMVKRHADIRVGEMEMGDLLEAKKIDMGAVEKAVKKVESLRSELSLYRVKALMRTKEFLTEEQFDKFREYTVGRMSYPMMRGGMYGSGRESMMPPGHGTMMPPGMMPGTPGMMMPYYDDEEDKESGEKDQKVMPR